MNSSRLHNYSAAIQTRDRSKDYHWNYSDGTVKHFTEVLRGLIDDTSKSIAITKKNDNWSLIFGGIKTQITDCYGRLIRVNMVFSGLGAQEARTLAILALDNWEKHTNTLLSAIEWPTSKDSLAPDQQEWTVDFDKLKNLLYELISANMGPPAPSSFSERWEFPYTPNNDTGAWSSLLNEIRSNNFSANDGIKLVVTNIPQDDALNKMRNEADRVLWNADNKCCLGTITAENIQTSNDEGGTSSPSQQQDLPSNESIGAQKMVASQKATSALLQTKPVRMQKVNLRARKWGSGIIVVAIAIATAILIHNIRARDAQKKNDKPIVIMQKLPVRSSASSPRTVHQNGMDIVPNQPTQAEGRKKILQKVE